MLTRTRSCSQSSLYYRLHFAPNVPLRDFLTQFSAKCRLGLATFNVSCIVHIIYMYVCHYSLNYSFLPSCYPLLAMHMCVQWRTHPFPLKPCTLHSYTEYCIGRLNLICTNIIQWNPSNLDAIGPEESVLISEVSIFRGVKSTQTWYLGMKKVSCLVRCPYFRGILIEGFHRISMYVHVHVLSMLTCSMFMYILTLGGFITVKLCQVVLFWYTNLCPKSHNLSRKHVFVCTSKI